MDKTTDACATTNMELVMTEIGARTYGVPAGTPVEIIGDTKAPILDAAWCDERRGNRQTGLVTVGEEVERVCEQSGRE